MFEKYVEFSTYLMEFSMLRGLIEQIGYQEMKNYTTEQWIPKIPIIAKRQISFKVSIVTSLFTSAEPFCKTFNGMQRWVLYPLNEPNKKFLFWLIFGWIKDSKWEQLQIDIQLPAGRFTDGYSFMQKNETTVHNVHENWEWQQN